MFEYLYYRLYHYYERCYKFFGGKNADWGGRGLPLLNQHSPNFVADRISVFAFP